MEANSYKLALTCANCETTLTVEGDDYAARFFDMAGCMIERHWERAANDAGAVVLICPSCARTEREV